jgi:hypothetical protein
MGGFLDRGEAIFMIDILQTIKDPKIFAQHFRRAESWSAWLVFLAALFALPMTPEQFEIYKQHTGRCTLPTTPSTEAWLVIGRRGGKSFILALIAVFLACFRDWRPYLGPGEVGTIMVVCADRRQARTIMQQCQCSSGRSKARHARASASRTTSSSRCTPHRFEQQEVTASSQLC